jgi:hypothetical protein
MTRSSTRAGVYKPSYGRFQGIDDVEENKKIKLDQNPGELVATHCCFFFVIVNNAPVFIKKTTPPCSTMTSGLE